MVFVKWLSSLGDLPWYILTRCTLLTCLLLASALLMLVRAGDYTLYTGALFAFAQQTVFTALLVFFAGLFGSALLEDIQRGQA